jgi:hypothetical protein
MKFTRKMVLVDYEKYMESKKNTQEIDTSPKPLYDLSKEMQEILEKKNLSDYTKHNKYSEKLNKYLFLAKNETNRKANDKVFKEEKEDLDEAKKIKIENIKQEF